MEKALAVFLWIAVGCTCLGADPVALDLTNPPPEWNGVLEALASNHPVKATFEESRTNPFHKRPRRFNGEIFWHPDYGLSLHYASPGEMKINISEKQVMLYRKEDPPRRLEMDEENPALGMFFRLFDWDMTWLDKSFSISGNINESEWNLQLRPYDELARKKLSRIDLDGADNLLQAIRLDFPGGREVRIKLSDQEYPWEPDWEFLRRQFEIPDDQE